MAEITSNFFVYAVALIITLGVLIAFHEYGHFWVARRFGVKVLRYSIGFGKPLWLRVSPRDGTEYAIAAVPLGGYVKMLDEREMPVDPSERHMAFGNKSVWARIAIVAAGPAANFLFAIVAFAAVFMLGVNGLKPLMAEPAAGSVAAAAGFQSRDLIVAVNGDATPTLNDAVLALVDHASAGDRVDVEVEDAAGVRRVRRLDVSASGDLTAEGRILEKLGLNLWQPKVAAVVDRVVAGSAADAAGLRAGDEIVGLDGEVIDDWTVWARAVRGLPGETITLDVLRDGARLTARLTPDPVELDDGGTIGRAGVYPRVPEEVGAEMRLLVQHGPLDALVNGAARTWEMSVFTLKMLGRMVTGRVSLENISGPLTIAQFAGRSAMIGLTAFISFMALVSISLGVLNLLPVPVLDGGHLLFYLIEIVKGSPVSEGAQQIGQQAGLAMIFMLMGLAIFNDVTRLFG